MTIEIIRECLDYCTIGKLYIDGQFFCNTIEPVALKAPAKPRAIDKGEYKVILEYSPRFKMKLPTPLGVKGFEGVRFHAGNSVKDTVGCILVGEQDKDNKELLKNSRATLSRLIKIIEPVGYCTLRIK